MVSKQFFMLCIMSIVTMSNFAGQQQGQMPEVTPDVCSMSTLFGVTLPLPQEISALCSEFAQEGIRSQQLPSIAIDQALVQSIASYIDASNSSKLVIAYSTGRDYKIQIIDQVTRMCEQTISIRGHHDNVVVQHVTAYVLDGKPQLVITGSDQSRQSYIYLVDVDSGAMTKSWRLPGRRPDAISIVDIEGALKYSGNRYVSDINEDGNKTSQIRVISIAHDILVYDIAPPIPVFLIQIDMREETPLVESNPGWRNRGRTQHIAVAKINGEKKIFVQMTEERTSGFPQGQVLWCVDLQTLRLDNKVNGVLDPQRTTLAFDIQTDEQGNLVKIARLLLERQIISGGTWWEHSTGLYDDYTATSDNIRTVLVEQDPQGNIITIQRSFVEVGRAYRMKYVDDDVLSVTCQKKNNRKYQLTVKLYKQGLQPITLLELPNAVGSCDAMTVDKSLHEINVCVQYKGGNASTMYRWGYPTRGQKSHSQTTQPMAQRNGLLRQYYQTVKKHLYATTISLSTAVCVITPLIWWLRARGKKG